MGNTASTTNADSTHGTATVTGLLAVVDWEALPASTRETIRTVGPLMVEGCSQKETARRLGVSDAAVAVMVAEIRGAIIAQAVAVCDSLEPPLRGLVEQLREKNAKAA
jgi:predicted transcriptional regulator